MDAKLVGGEIDLSGWHFDFGEFIKTEEITKQLAEGIANSLDGYVRLGWAEDDLPIHFVLFGFGDNGPEYKFGLGELIEETLFLNGPLDDEGREDAEAIRSALLALAQRVADTIEVSKAAKAS